MKSDTARSGAHPGSLQATWFFSACAWGGVGAAASLMVLLDVWSGMLQVAQDAFFLGCAGSASGGLLVLRFWKTRLGNNTQRDWLNLAATFWNAAVISLILAHGIAGRAWLSPVVATPYSASVGAALCIALRLTYRRRAVV